MCRFFIGHHFCFCLLSPLLFFDRKCIRWIIFSRQICWQRADRLKNMSKVVRPSTYYQGKRKAILPAIQQIVPQITLINFCVSVRFTIDIQTQWNIATTWKSLCLLTLKGITGRVRRNFFQFYGAEFFCRAKLIHIKNQTFSGQS